MSKLEMSSKRKKPYTKAEAIVIIAWINKETGVSSVNKNTWTQMTDIVLSSYDHDTRQGNAALRAILILLGR